MAHHNETLAPADERGPARDEGVCFARTDEGIELPVIDVTHPAFALDASEAAVQRLTEEYAAQRRAWAAKPALVRRAMFWLAGRKSVLLRSFRQSDGTFLGAMSTYLLKVGPRYLSPAWARPLDWKVAASPGITDVRLRLQIMAHLIANGVRLPLTARPGAPLHLIDIAGGPAIDALNAVIVLRKESPSLLHGRRVFVHVLDFEDAGPHFGARALAALQGQSGPLSGIECTFEHHHYDWNQPDALGGLLRRLPAGAVAAGSSEGGLFHYGSDDAIRRNLRALRDHTAADFTVTGSYSPPSEDHSDASRFIRLKARYLADETFARLASESGWQASETFRGPRTHCVRLARV